MVKCMNCCYVSELINEDTCKNCNEDNIQKNNKYDLGYYHLGNGYRVSNRLVEEYGDYKKVAHINWDRTVTFYDNNLPQELKDQILNVACTDNSNISATQDQKIFKPIE